MTRERVAGRFTREDGEPGEPEPPRHKPPRPGRAKAFARARFAEALPGIMDRLLKEVLDGSVPHLKVVLELTGLDEPELAPAAGRRKEKSLETILLERWKRDGEEELARRAEAARQAEAAAAQGL